MNPDRHASSHYDYFKDLIKGDDASTEAHRKFYDEYNAVLDMDADYYLETIQTVFREFKLVNGTWDVQNPKGKAERVRPQDIKTTALLSVEGELDDISGSGQTAAAHDLCTGIAKNKRHHFEVKGAGHYGILSGRRWREMVYPVVKKFILEHTPKSAVAAAPVSLAAPKAAPVATSKPTAKPSAAKVAAKATTAVAPQPTAKAAKPVAKSVVAAKPAVKPAAKAAVKSAAVAVVTPAKVVTPAAKPLAKAASAKAATKAVVVAPVVATPAVAAPSAPAVATPSAVATPAAAANTSATGNTGNTGA